MVEQLTFDLSPKGPNKIKELWSVDEIFNNANEYLLKELEEDSRIERKSARVQAKDIGDYLSVFANRQPDGGIIVIGIEDNSTITGCRGLSTRQLSELEDVRVHCQDARYETKKISAHTDQGCSDYLLLIRVHYRSDRLVKNAKGEAYVKAGRNKRRLLNDEMREYQISKGEVDYELEQVSLSYPTDFDINLIKQYVASYAKIRDLNYEHTDVAVLCSSKLGRIDSGRFYPNLACALLFAKDVREVVPGARIRLLRYDGVEEGVGKNLNLIKDTWLEGPLPNQIVNAEKAVDAQMRDFTRLGHDGKFYTRPEYPREAWLEAIVNACAHRSYNFKAMSVVIKMFDDRFVVESPGGFRPPVTAENIYDLNMSNPRNPHLMDALMYLRFVKQMHEGTKRMLLAMQEANLPSPEFTQREVAGHQVQVILRNDAAARKQYLDADLVDVVSKNVLETLTKQEKQIINRLAEAETISVTDASTLINRDWRAAKKTLISLVAKGLVRRHGKSGKTRESTARYVLVRPEEHGDAQEDG